MQIRELEEQLATLQKAVHVKDASGGGSGSSSFLVPPLQNEYDYDYEQLDHHQALGDDMDEDVDGSPLPKVESPLPHTISPDPAEHANPDLMDELYVSPPSVLLTILFLVCRLLMPRFSHVLTD